MRKVPGLPLILCIALFLQPTVALAVRQVTRSAEYPSPMGVYDSMSVSRTLRIGIQTVDPPRFDPDPGYNMPAVPAAANPLDAAQGLVTINGNLHVQPLDAAFADTTGIEHASTRVLRDVIIDENLQVDGDTFKVRSLSWWGESHWTLINIPGFPAANVRSGEMHVNGDVYAQRFRASSNAWGIDDNEQLLFFGPSNDGDSYDGDWVEVRAKTGRSNPPHPANDSGWEHGESILVVKGNPYIILNGYSRANVGIGTEAPAYLLQIGNAGDGFQAISHSWQVYSSRDFKTDIRPLSQAEYSSIADRAADLNLVRYRYKKDRPDDVKKFGVIAEEAPKEIISNDGMTMSLGDTVGFLFAAIRGMKAENDLLKVEIEKLERRAM